MSGLAKATSLPICDSSSFHFCQNSGVSSVQILMVVSVELWRTKTGVSTYGQAVVALNIFSHLQYKTGQYSLPDTVDMLSFSHARFITDTIPSQKGSIQK